MSSIAGGHEHEFYHHYEPCMLSGFLESGTSGKLKLAGLCTFLEVDLSTSLIDKYASICG